jgi:ActR/RegA family two-component response regulator
MTAGKVLIIDDDEIFLGAYETKLAREGYVIETARSQEGALQKLDQTGWDAILLDQRLSGSSGADTGLDLIPEIVRRAPRARIMLVTGYGTPKAVAAAFEAGAHDYLQKDELFKALLIPKLRAAVEVARAMRLAAMSSDETEAEIRRTWADARSERDANRKGKLLEDLMVLILTTIPGFQHASPRRRNELEEIDILVRNESTDPLWMKEGTHMLVECKNWSHPVGVKELRDFAYKVEHRYGRCRLGLFVAPGGFADTVKQHLLRDGKDNTLILLLDADDLTQLVEASDRNAYLKKLHTDALIAQNGH